VVLSRDLTAAAPAAGLAFAARAIAAAALLLGAVPAHAQRATPPAAAITPLEMRACRYAEGKSAADLDGLARTFNRWLADNHAPDYQAYVLTPIAYSSEADFDFEWLGWWPDGTTMGESMAQKTARRWARAWRSTSAAAPSSAPRSTR
jgi:hypothetical protein